MNYLIAYVNQGVGQIRFGNEISVGMYQQEARSYLLGNNVMSAKELMDPVSFIRLTLFFNAFILWNNKAELSTLL
jgi:hypothetical protein